MSQEEIDTKTREVYIAKDQLILRRVALFVG